MEYDAKRRVRIAINTNDIKISNYLTEFQKIRDRISFHCSQIVGETHGVYTARVLLTDKMQRWRRLQICVKRTFEQIRERGMLIAAALAVGGQS